MCVCVCVCICVSVCVCVCDVIQSTDFISLIYILLRDSFKLMYIQTIKINQYNYFQIVHLIKFDQRPHNPTINRPPPYLCGGGEQILISHLGVR